MPAFSTQDVDRPELGLDLREGRVDRGVVRDVERHVERALDLGRLRGRRRRSSHRARGRSRPCDGRCRGRTPVTSAVRPSNPSRRIAVDGAGGTAMMGRAPGPQSLLDTIADATKEPALALPPAWSSPRDQHPPVPLRRPRRGRHGRRLRHRPSHGGAAARRGRRRARRRPQRGAARDARRLCAARLRSLDARRGAGGRRGSRAA